MSQPPAYTPAYDFSDFELTNPDDPKPGTSLDIEFGAIETSISGIRTNLALIQADSGGLKGGIVTPDSLSADTLALFASGINPTGAWVTATAYEALDLVTQDSLTYVCVTAHTSGTFATDLAASKWMLWVNGPTTSGTAFFQKFTGDGSNTIFTLSQNLGTDEKNLLVFKATGGAWAPLAPDVDYTVSGTTLTLVVAPAAVANNLYVFSPNQFIGAAEAYATAAEEARDDILDDPGFIAVSAITDDITTVAGDSADIATLAAISTDIQTVADLATQVSAVASNMPLSNRTATADPAVTDDTGDGYSPGSLWINNTTDHAFICTDSAAGAAKWIRINTGFVELPPIWLSTPDGDLVADTNIASLVVRHGFTITNVYAHVEVSPTTSGITVDINKNGSTILSTKLTIDATESDSATAAAPAVLSTTTLAANDVLSFDIDAVDSGNTAAGLQVSVCGYYNYT